MEDFSNFNNFDEPPNGEVDSISVQGPRMYEQEEWVEIGQMKLQMEEKKEESRRQMEQKDEELRRQKEEIEDLRRQTEQEKEDLGRQMERGKQTSRHQMEQDQDGDETTEGSGTAGQEIERKRKRR